MPKANPKFDFTRIDRRSARVTPALIDAVRDRIIEHLLPEKIILFGSRVKGKATPDSDIDLMIVLNNNHPLSGVKQRDRFGAVLDLFHYRSFGLDAIVLTDAEVEKNRRENEGEWDLVLEILEEGMVIYDRTQTENKRASSTTRARMVPQG